MWIESGRERGLCVYVWTDHRGASVLVLLGSPRKGGKGKGPEAPLFPPAEHFRFPVRLQLSDGEENKTRGEGEERTENEGGFLPNVCFFPKNSFWKRKKDKKEINNNNKKFF